ncbi:MAG: hypothetical protein LIP28_06390 [Deltaproteobacteria bacterium]|nr:hypothetical protein [Deltaproteobacteria bacterium]
MAEDLPPDPGNNAPEEASAVARGDASPAAPLPAPSPVPPADCSWSAFLRFCKQRQDLPASFAGMIRTVAGEWKNGILELTPGSEFCAERLRSPETAAMLAALVREYYGGAAGVRLLPPPRVKTAAEIKEAILKHPAVHLLEKELGARLIDYGHPGQG